MSLGYRELINQVDSTIRSEILRNLEDLESSVEGIVEVISEVLNIGKPRVIITINNINECGKSDSGLCSAIMGLYAADSQVMLVNYRISLSALLHLLAHHLQALEMGKDKYIQVKGSEELRLPWEVRPLEVNAMVRTIRLAKATPPKVFKVWNEEVRPLVKVIEESVNRVKALITHLSRGIDLTVMNSNA